MKYFIIFLLTTVIFGRLYFSRPVYRDNQKLKITTTVLTEPIRYSSYQKLEVAGLTANFPLYPEVFYGDRVTVIGVVEGDKLKKPDLIKTERGGNILFTFRQKLISFYKQALPEPHASLVAGITIGSKSGFPEWFYNALKNTGTAHIVVASGTNVVFVSAFIFAICLLYLTRKKAIIITLLSIWIYALISGLEAPIIRASVMASLVFLAQLSSRLISPLRALAISVYLMLVVRPDWIGDLGFLLSVAATLSLVLFGNQINSKLGKIPGFIRGDLATSLAAQVGVVPILALAFDQVYLLSPLVNVLVLWTIAPLMIIGMMGGLVGLIAPGIGELILYLGYPLSWWFSKVVGFFNT